MSTYGIDDSKSRVEVFPATQVYKKSEVYNKTETYAKSEVYNKTEADEKFLAQVAGAPKNHASSSNTYGLGTASNFGHVKLTTSTAMPSGDQNGIALAGSMGYTLKKYIDDAIAAITGGEVPVHGIVAMDNWDWNVRTLYGYGVWEYIGSATTSNNVNVYFFKRVS